jgi:hypothetical protein
MLHYTELTADVLKGLNLKLVKDSGRSHKADCYYYDIEVGFDIEASSVYVDGQKQALMYVWMFGIGKDQPVYYGRTWEELLTCLTIVTTSLDVSMTKRLVIYIHNMAYEFQFMKQLFNWASVFSIGERTPIKALTENGIEFRDSYILSGMSLADVAKNLADTNLSKMTGDLDYSKVRHSETPLTEAEMGYCESDIRILTSYVAEQIDLYDHITRIPATNTGRVRKYVRDECYYTNPKNHRKSSIGRFQSYRELMVGTEALKEPTEGAFNPGLQLTTGDYKQLKRAFTGGYTHANRNYRGQVLTDVSSFDLNSAYPGVMLTEQFPMSAARKVDISSPNDVEKLMENYLVMFDMKLTGVRTSIQQENYLSASKCWELEGELLNNGRVYSANRLSTTVTDVDYRIIKRAYSYKTIDITNVRIYKKGYLPRAILRSILTLYQGKTTLKGVEGREKEYTLSKGMLNSVFGMTVTDVVQVRNLYTDEWTQECDPADKQVNQYNKSENRFLYYPWGVWITAYARQNLWSAILEAGDDYVYSDTDSIKLLNVKGHIPYINKYNKLVVQKLTQMNTIYQFDDNLLFPAMPNGETKVIGTWDYEGTYDRFKTLGPKRYLTEKKGKYSLTLAGLSKEKGLRYLLGKDSNEFPIFDLFDLDLHVPPEHTGKLLHTYIDVPATFELTDYTGNITTVHTLGGVHLEGTDFTLSIETEVGYVLGMLATEGYLKEGNFYDGN